MSTFHPIRALAFLTTLLLAAASLPTAQAGTVEQPEISDLAGDVQPGSALVQLPQDLSFVQHADLADIVKVYIPAESADAFVLKIEVADLPDDWILEPGTAGDPVPALSAFDEEIRWNDNWFRYELNITSHFMIDGVEYELVAQLAQLDLENPNSFPAVYSKALIEERLADSDAILAEQRAQLNSVLFLPGPVSPKDRALENITVAQTHIAAARMAVNDELDDGALEGMFNEHMDTAGEHIGAAAILIEENAPGSSVQQVVLDALAEADAKLSEARRLADALPQAGVAGAGLPTDVNAPRVLLFHQFHLEDESGVAHEIDGSIDLKADEIQMRILKAAVGSPSLGDVLTKFRASSTYNEIALDFAPDATNASPFADPETIVYDALEGKFVSPAFGRDYVFSYRAPAPSPEPSPSSSSQPVTPIAVWTLAVSGKDAQSIEPGGAATYAFTLRNTGTGPVSGYLFLSSAADGWTHQVSDIDFSLAPGASLIGDVVVSGIEGGAGSQVSELTAMEAGGSTKKIMFTTSMAEAPSPQGEDKDPPVPASKGDSPGIGLVALLVVVVALVAWGRRRTM